ncbi:MAG: hypothetical protein JSU00_15810 [Acidobacteria bacterium]|nr:hypothetical protein [Acidobacteriota bacterium]
MQQHVKILGWLNIVYGGLGVLAGIIVFAVLGGVAGFIQQVDSSHDADQAAVILPIIGVGILVFLLVLSAPAIIAGWGLLSFRPWARVLTIILSALHLLSIPFGTALGVYGLWVLLQAETEPMFRQPQPQYPPQPRPYA